MRMSVILGVFWLGLSGLAVADHHDEAAPAPPGIEAEAELFEHVRYVDKREMACCAVPMIIEVNDPCYVEPKSHCKSDCCSACECCSKCESCCEAEAPVHPKVLIQICVPKCCAEKEVTITSRRDGDLVRYDFGEYAVDVRVRRGFIVVDYQH